jgi:dTDP-4-amino-4,6-dideoxy-D-galactose acyltransferase
MNTDPPSTCRKLDWDSNFFGFGIGRIALNRLNKQTATHAKAWAKANHIACLYWLCDAEDGASVQAAEQAGFSLIDIRMTFERKVQPDDGAVAAPAVRVWQTHDLAVMRSLASHSHTDTRFYRDGRFPRERCDALYAAWIENSCNGFAQVVFVADVEDHMAGYVTCHLHGDEANLGLIAVDECAQGRGIGSQLTQAFLRWAMQQGVRRATVVTQGHNLRAQRLYQRCGFITASMQLSYHFWL